MSAKSSTASPRHRQSGSREAQNFEIGLVMAGAISAGAYTAGVLDFLIEALDNWYEAREDKWAQERANKGGKRFKSPSHGVRIKVMSGASAGSMVTALSAISLSGKFEPCQDVDNPPDGRRNRLFDAWVTQIDIEHLLAGEDLAGGDGPVVSLLDSTVLDRIVANSMIIDQRTLRRSYVDKELHTFFSVTNLRGIPYGFRFAGAKTSYFHGMTAHQDYMRYAFLWSGLVKGEAITLDAANVGQGDAEVWKQFGQSTLASGAFPVGLAPRIISRRGTDYSLRDWKVPQETPLVKVGNNYQCVCTELRKVNPLWPQDMSDKNGDLEEPWRSGYEFVSVDGGVMNNEPLELARRYLASGGRNERDPKKSKRAIIMIDPFPNHPVVTKKRKLQRDIISVITGTFFSLIRQARFKIDELVLAGNDDVASRFIIFPVRARPKRSSNTDSTNSRTLSERVEPAIASAILGGFGGFFSRAFRAHDYQLGRRNCQRFLQRHFVLPTSNPLFGGWKGEEFVEKNINGRPTKCQPIIPLLRSAKSLVPPPVAVGSGNYEVRKKAIEKLIIRRTNLVGLRLISPMTGILGWIVRRIAWPVLLRWKLRNLVLSKFRAEMQMGLKDLDDSYSAR